MRSQLGKVVLDDLYVHRDSVDLLDSALRQLVVAALAEAPAPARARANVIKLNRRSSRVSLLAYAEFFADPFPSLTESWRLYGDDGYSVKYRSYAESLNPPILHRKELLLPPDHPQRKAFEEVTRHAEALGLFDETSTIGFRENWQKIIASKGYCLDGDRFVPLANDTTSSLDNSFGALCPSPVMRHLTALSRNVLSAPVQLLDRHGFLRHDWMLFDYGCGRGDDIAALGSNGYAVAGWDPHYRPENPIVRSAVVNLGFVLNVIEDQSERRDALRRAFELTEKVLSVAVMLHGSSTPGVPYCDGFRTSRNTFQKYFSQEEFRQYLAHELNEEVFLVGPGVGFIFKDKELEQRFTTNRYRRKDLVYRLLRGSKETQKPKHRRHQSRVTSRLTDETRAILDMVWSAALELGRMPERDEIDATVPIEEHFGSLRRVTRIIYTIYAKDQLQSAAQVRTDDLRLFFAMQLFERRAPYRNLERRLQRDIKAFFGDYRGANASGTRLLLDAAESSEVRRACELAAERGMGWFDGESALHVHVSVIDRLPVVLRAYISCGLLIYADTSEVQLIKVHSSSGKLTLMAYEDFETSPLPSMVKRVKISIRRQDYDVFEYGDKYEKPLLYYKSRYLHEEYPGYAEQHAFDESLAALELFEPNSYGLPARELDDLLNQRRLVIAGLRLVRSQRVPSLDQPCGMNFRYRDFLECGETQRQLLIKNVPERPETYNALYDLATRVLDPVIEYFGSVRLTYGFCSRELSRHIKARIAPRLDQHAAHERNAEGNPICLRGGAACDFIVEDEDMEEVAAWIMLHLPFDRLYFYGKDRPLHVSYAENPVGLAYELQADASGRRVPKPMRRAQQTGSA
ncbi:DNA phosphorothioation-associated putative methyltransferase [Paraburkholderia terricola]|uniref:DNA phosphorothioation-associated putative methyltransferase n=1 Tax=Paraburkholderia terricola TaxID=169427 RepID=UPI00285B5A80|nr:DNA phosphorothioation-associated putative methyltransferase [Paraburkholderia terricola]MDR6496390.1 DNA phosphorothioation-associated putative methyltransferase [Paraburkholderia terricola]